MGAEGWEGKKSFPPAWAAQLSARGTKALSAPWLWPFCRVFGGGSAGLKFPCGSMTCEVSGFLLTRLVGTPTVRGRSGSPEAACFWRLQGQKKPPKSANTANTANGAFGAPPKTRYNHHPVNDKLTAPPGFALGQEPVPGRFKPRSSRFLHLFPVIST
jgi:hypothetical protein